MEWSVVREEGVCGRSLEVVEGSLLRLASVRSPSRAAATGAQGGRSGRRARLGGGLQFERSGVDALTAKIKGFLGHGYETFKVKIGFDQRSDIVLAETARRAIGDLPLRLDVNGAWTPGTPGGSSKSSKPSIRPMSSNRLNSTISPAMSHCARSRASPARAMRAPIGAA